MIHYIITDKKAAIQTRLLQKKEIERDFIRFLKEELSIADELVDPNTPFQSLGVNSIKMMKLARSIEKTYHIRLTARESHKNLTIGALAAYTAEKAANMSADHHPQKAEPPAERERRQTAPALSEVQKGCGHCRKCRLKRLHTMSRSVSDSHPESTKRN
ncbi:acyl carrier protein [Bacillus velezensis]|nr:acyl carrier protein [Bacillus velezensis]